MLKWLLLALFVASVAFVHLRGRVRHNFFRQLFDHSGLLAPLNVFMYALSGVRNQPYIPTEAFPELAKLRAHWPQIRDEGVQLMRARPNCACPIGTTMRASTRLPKPAGSGFI